MQQLIKWVKRKLRRTVREWQIAKSYRQPLPAAMPERDKPCVVHVMNNQLKHGGLLDRIKGSISAYQIAQRLGNDFKIYVDQSSFDLFRYLTPKDASLVCITEELHLNTGVSKPLYLNDYRPDSVQQLLASFTGNYRQFHVYGNQDYTSLLQPQLFKEDYGKYWSTLFHELFQFSDFLVHHAAGKLPNNGLPLVGVHSRFMGLLGDFQDVNNANIDTAAQNKLLEKCIVSVRQIAMENTACNILAVSDSARFLQAVQLDARGHNYASRLQIDAENIGHIDVNHADEVLCKAFTDFYLLCQCEMVHQLLFGNMYHSQFSRYAAYVGNASLVAVTE
ncbi:hypothetical protein [Phnomibacter sp. MR]|uniref:hypothetical protein n=1 Tax=Phnomibacter sp. MR TaxID=3042318 RepID=UPI003A7FD2E7